MEASDAFKDEPGAALDEDDPFAGSEFEEDWDGDPDPSTTPEVAQPAQPAQPEVPIVNAEGERVEPAAAAEPAAPPAQAAEPDPPAVPPAAAPAAPPAAAPEASSAAPAAEPVPAQAPEQPSTPAAGTPAATPETPEEPPAAAQAPAEPQNAVAEPEEPQPADAQAEELPEPEDAETPEEIKDKKGRVALRNYVVLLVEGNGKFRQVTWYEDKAGKMVTRGTPGAKRQSYALARDATGALATGFAAMGAPEGGVPLVAVAASHFQIKNVAPKEDPQPRRRLSIS